MATQYHLHSSFGLPDFTPSSPPFFFIGTYPLSKFCVSCNAKAHNSIVLQHSSLIFSVSCGKNNSSRPSLACLLFVSSKQVMLLDSLYFIIRTRSVRPSLRWSLISFIPHGLVHLGCQEYWHQRYWTRYWSVRMRTARWSMICWPATLACN